MFDSVRCTWAELFTHSNNIGITCDIIPYAKLAKCDKQNNYAY